MSEQIWILERAGKDSDDFSPYKVINIGNYEENKSEAIEQASYWEKITAYKYRASEYERVQSINEVRYK